LKNLEQFGWYLAQLAHEHSQNPAYWIDAKIELAQKKATPWAGMMFLVGIEEVMGIRSDTTVFECENRNDTALT
jgi:hypothetical protein